MQKKNCKSIKELVEFINDLSITCSICSTQVFLLLSALSVIRNTVSLFNRTYCHLFCEYIHKKVIVESLRNHGHTQVSPETSLGRFFKNTRTHS